MGKTSENKKQKIEKLLNASFELFTKKGFNDTTISDIVNKAEVAKGTFYLYFKDKYDIRNKLLSHKTSQLFVKAYQSAIKNNINDFEDRIIFIMDYVLDELEFNKGLLAFIYKDLSWAIFKKALISPMEEENANFKQLYDKMIEDSKINFKNPEIMLFLIIELIGSTGYSAIMYNDPISLNELKPHLENTVRTIIHQYVN